MEHVGKRTRLGRNARSKRPSGRMRQKPSAAARNRGAAGKRRMYMPLALPSEFVGQKTRMYIGFQVGVLQRKNKDVIEIEKCLVEGSSNQQ